MALHPRAALPVAASLLLGACAAPRPIATTPAPAAQPAAAAATPVTSAREASIAGLRAFVAGLVEDPQFRNAHWGILIVDPATGDTLVSRNADKLFMPASNMKIVTGAVALATLGSDFRFATTLAARGTIRQGTLHGDLVVHGRGDPSFSTRVHGDAMLPMRQLADSLAARGIRRITGRVMSGEDAFPDAIYGAGWSWDDFGASYSAPVDELIFNEGFTPITIVAGTSPGSRALVSIPEGWRHPRVRTSVTTAAESDQRPGGQTTQAPVLLIRRDSASGEVHLEGEVAPGSRRTIEVAQTDPAAAFLAAFRSALDDRGVTVGGRSLATVAAREDTLFVFRSPPFREILAHMEKPSQNQIAEIVLKTLGLERAGVGSADSGRAVVGRQLREWGVPDDGYIVRDGSGLSRYNYLSPRAVVAVLSSMHRHSAFAIFRESLPVAGVDGTLASRMKDTPAMGNARAKTGFIAQARSLSGYVTTVNGREVVFSLLANNWTAPRREIERVQDEIVARLAAMELPER